MRKILGSLSIVTFVTMLTLISSNAHAFEQEKGWWESLLSTFGLGDDAAEAEDSGPSLDGLVSSISEHLGVSKEQAQGGIAAVFNYAKQNVSAEKFAQLSEQIPGLENVMQYLPEVENVSSEGLGGLLDKAASYSESLSQINNLKKQFNALGLDTGMVQEYIEQARSYLDTPEGAKAKALLQDSFSKLII